MHTNSIQIGYLGLHHETSNESIFIVYDDDSKKWTWPGLHDTNILFEDISSLPFFKEIERDGAQEK